MWRQEPTHDTLVAKVLRKASPGWSYCFRCGMPWKYVKGHTTNYTPSSGCFPLCVGCWTELGHPEARIEYYDMLIDAWEASGLEVSQDEKNDIAKAVANGG